MLFLQRNKEILPKTIQREFSSWKVEYSIRSSMIKKNTDTYNIYLVKLKTITGTNFLLHHLVIIWLKIIFNKKSNNNYYY